MAKIDKLCHNDSLFDIRRIKMATMNISLPEAMKGWVEAQAETGKYSNSSDFIRDIIRREQLREEKIARMQALVDEARAGGISPNMPEDIRQRVLKRHGLVQN
jgi:antitoxin ParD1/3/4